MLLFFKGLLIGFAIAAPVGPIGLLCIKRTLSDGRVAGFISGLGAAAADAAYGFIAALGLTVIGEFLVDHKSALSVLGGCFLIYLGYAEWRAKPIDPTVAPPNPMGLIGHFVSTFFLTLANPMTILSFIGIFVGLDVAGPGGQIGPADQEFVGMTRLVSGVFLGSALWWLTLSGGVGSIRHWLGGHTILWLNRGAGTLIILFGLYALTEVVNL